MIVSCSCFSYLIDSHATLSVNILARVLLDKFFVVQILCFNLCISIHGWDIAKIVILILLILPTLVDLCDIEFIVAIFFRNLC